MRPHQRVYKIRRRDDGRYSTGGYSPGWLKTGKIWHRLSDVQKHMRYVTEYARKQYEESDVIEFQLVPTAKL